MDGFTGALDGTDDGDDDIVNEDIKFMEIISDASLECNPDLARLKT